MAGRLAPPPFSDEEILRGKAVAFWAAAALRRGQLLEQVRRYAAFLEQVVALDEKVFDGAGPDEVAQALKKRAGGPLLMVDISTPRNIDPAVGDLPDVFLYNIDKLEAVVKEQFKLEIPGGNIDNAILATIASKRFLT